MAGATRGTDVRSKQQYGWILLQPEARRIEPTRPCLDLFRNHAQEANSLTSKGEVGGSPRLPSPIAKHRQGDLPEALHQPQTHHLSITMSRVHGTGSSLLLHAVVLRSWPWWPSFHSPLSQTWRGLQTRKHTPIPQAHPLELGLRVYGIGLERVSRSDSVQSQNRTA